MNKIKLNDKTGRRNKNFFIFSLSGIEWLLDMFLQNICIEFNNQL